MKEIVLNAKTIADPSFEVELQNNAHFSDDVADWIEENINILWLSGDGSPEIQVICP